MIENRGPNQLSKSWKSVVKLVHENRFPLATFEALFFLHLVSYFTLDPHISISALNLFAPLPKSDVNEIASNLGYLTVEIAKLLLLQPIVKGGAMLIADRISKESEAKALKERIQTGTEPVPPDVSPSHVLIGNSKIISDLSRLEKSTNNDKEWVVAIHPDSGRISTLGSKVDRHFQADVDAITDIADFITEETPMIEVTGLNKAQEITFVCINPENAIFYGEKAEALFKPTDVSTILSKILENNPSGLQDKKVNVIMNDIKEFEGSVEVAKELEAMSREYGFTLHLISPERQVMAMIQNKVNEIAKTKNEYDNINITLVGQGGTEKDEFMLEEFSGALKIMKMDDVKNNIDVSVIKRKKSSSSKDIELARRLEESDLIFAYGDDDSGTSSLVRLMVGGLKIDNGKIHALIEKKKNIFDLVNRFSLDNENVHCIYDMVMGAYSA